MAIDPRLLLSSTPIDVGGTFRNALLNIQSAEALEERQRQAPLRSRMLEAQVQSAEQGVLSPEQVVGQRDLARLASVARFSQQALPALQQGDIQGVRSALERRRRDLAAAADSGQQVDTSDTDEALQLLDTNPQLLAQRMQQAIAAQQALDSAGPTAAQREFSGLTKGLSDEDVVKARRIELGLEPRAGISAQERIAADPSLTQQVAGSEAVITGAKEGAKLTQQLAFKPAIQREVKLAEAKAAEEGEVFTDLARSKAALPGLIDVVGKLKELAPVATSTLTGKVFNAASKELGFGATKGATARAAFVATVRNQVLPLLRETFGAAFTAAEGEKLEAAFADPDASPQEKVAQLESFIQQKQRSIETKERQAEILSPEVNQPQSTRIVFDAQGNIVQ